MTSRFGLLRWMMGASLISTVALAAPAPRRPVPLAPSQQRTIVLLKSSLFSALPRPRQINASFFRTKAQAVQVLVQDIQRHYGLKIIHTYSAALEGFSAVIPAAILPELQNDPRIESTEPDLVARRFPYAHTSQNPTEPPPEEDTPPQTTQVIPTGVQRMGVLHHPIAHIDGHDDRVDVDVAVIDTGAEATHPDLNVFQQVNFSQETSAEDGDGHGTHVSGIIGALDNDFGVVGVAPGVRIWAVKVLNNNGSGMISDIIKGVDYVTQHANEIEVANMSLGAMGTSRSLRRAISASVDMGVFYAVAAGNEERDIYGFDQVYGTIDDVIPASFPEVATVSALSDTDGKSGGFGAPFRNGLEWDDTLATFSNFSTNVIGQHPVSSPGAAIDLAAPGVNILSTDMLGGYVRHSGTSMASPHIAGLAALYIAQFGRAYTRYSVERIRQALIDFSEPQIQWNQVRDPADPDLQPEPLGNAEAISALGPRLVHQ